MIDSRYKVALGKTVSETATINLWQNNMLPDNFRRKYIFLYLSLLR